MSLYRRLGRFMCRRSYATYLLWLYLIVVPCLLALLPGVILRAARDALSKCWEEYREIVPHSAADWRALRQDR